MDSVHNGPCSADPSIPMTSAMTTGTSQSKAFPAMASRTHRRGAGPLNRGKRPSPRKLERPNVDYRSRMGQPMANTNDQIDVLIINWHNAIACREIHAVVQQKSLT